MQVLETASQQAEAQMLQNLLRSHGIDCEVVGSRNYASIILGGGEGRYRIYVPDTELDRARAILREIRVRDANEITEVPTNPFRRAVFFAFAAALILPVVFNYASLQHGWIYWKTSDQNLIARAKFTLILLLQLPPFVFAGYLITQAYNLF